MPSTAIERYRRRLCEILDEAFDREAGALERAARVIADADLNDRSVFAFGCNHAGLVALELFYRTGGLVTINPVRAPGMMLEVTPITRSSEMERTPGYGADIFGALPARGGDVLIIHSVSGRNAVTVDMAAAAKAKGLTVIVLTNLRTANAVASRHPSGKKLHDFADVLIDNHGDRGDAVVELPGFPQKTAASSTAVGAALLNAVVARAAEMLIEAGVTPPVFMSGNIDGGDEHNRAVIESRRDHIFYM